MEFPLSPHVKSILCGKGMCKAGRLLCSATNCLNHPKDSSDPNFGRDIHIKGYVICPRCGVKTDYSEAEWDDRGRQLRIKCRVCQKNLSIRKMVWTQIVISKHRRHNHEYFHKECWEAMFIDLDYEDDDVALFYGYYSDNLIIRLIKWASRV